MFHFLLTLLGSVALLLWGMRLVQAGLQEAFGARLRTFLSAALRRRSLGFLAGAAVTAALQSSTATALMTASFVGAQWVALGPALAVMLGAYVGTTLIVLALAFPVAALAPALTVAGFILLNRMHSPLRHLGGMLLGLSLVLVSLRQLVVTIESQADSAVMRLMWDQLFAQPLPALIVAALLAWLAHSSVAIVLLVMSLAAQGVVSLPIAFALVLGANLGTTLNPLFEGAARVDRLARRLPIGILAIRLLGIVVALPLLGPVASGFAAIDVDDAHRVALLHTAFNLALAILVLPIVTAYGKALERWLPGRVGVRDPAAPRYLSERDHEARVIAPVIALGRAAREALRLADALERMLVGLRGAFDEADHEQILATRSLDDVLDRLNSAIKTHVMELDPARMSEPDQRRAAQILAFTMHLEQAGDLIDSRLLSLTAKRVARGLAFSVEGHAELAGLMDRLQVNLRSAAGVFTSGDPRAARLLAQEKDRFRELVSTATANHFTRLRSRRISSLETTALHLDMLQVLKQVNSHVIEGAAYPLLEGAGALLPSRLRPENDTLGVPRHV